MSLYAKCDDNTDCHFYHKNTISRNGFDRSSCDYERGLSCATVCPCPWFRLQGRGAKYVKYSKEGAALPGIIVQWCKTHQLRRLKNLILILE